MVVRGAIGRDVVGRQVIVRGVIASTVALAGFAAIASLAAVAAAAHAQPPVPARGASASGLPSAGSRTVAVAPEAAARPRAPSGPPLVSGAAAYGTPQAGGESESESAAGSEDPLVRNGLGSPLCGLSANALSAAAASDCRTSGFVAAGAPSEDYSFDTNIDTTFGVSFDALLQDDLVRPAWMGIVWLVHGVLVGLEWAYALDLLRGPLAGGLAPALRAAEAQFTRPWLVGALAVAAVLAAYHGLVRRRVAETIGEAVAMLAMIAAAMFVIADPSGTVGVLSRWTQEASVGTFGAVDSGSSVRPYAALAGSMQEIYAATIEAPWCFLEFGDVAWCDRPSRLDPRLRKAALRIAGRIEAEAQGPASGAGPGAEALMQRARLLRAARTNGGIFLALPANGLLRNSVKAPGSLLYVLCGGGGDATECRGPTAAEAEFRAGSGTVPRIGGLIVSALGVLGMLLLVGMIVVRLLEAAIVSLLFLLLAPAAALAPAFGEAGRGAFRRWAGRLLGAVTAKLLWSIVLGALLATMRILLGLEGVGWLAQWLLMGVLWWGLLLQRHRLLGAIAPRGELADARQARLSRRREDALRSLGRRVGEGALGRVRKGLPRLPRARGDGDRAPGPAGAKDQLLSARVAGSEAIVADAVPPLAVQKPEAHPQVALVGSPTARERPRGAGLARRAPRGEQQVAPQGPGPGEPYVPAFFRAGPEQAPARGGRDPQAHDQVGSDRDPQDRAPARGANAGGRAPVGGPFASERAPAGGPFVGGGELDAPSAPSAAPRSERGATPEAGSARASGAGGRAAGRPGTEASSPRAAGGAGARGGNAGADPRAARRDLDREMGMRRDERLGPSDTFGRGEERSGPSDPIMRDALEVARKRKRQLGWSWRDDG